MGSTAALIIVLFVLGIDESAAAKSVEKDVEYANADSHSLKLDFYRPVAEHPPLLVWVHGGAWRSGSKDSVPVQPLVDRGFAIASVNYRLSPVAPFPAQVHDIKAAIRFLRANADRFGFDPDQVVIAGASAGGHLAALVGVTNGDDNLEGDVGNHLDQSSHVTAIVSYYGASNLTTILNQSTPHGLSVRVPALKLLLGDRPANATELTRQASPVFHVDPTDPPLLLFHGDQDPQMPINQAHELVGKYQHAKRPVDLKVIYGGTHGGPEFYTDAQFDVVEHFLHKHLRTAANSDP